MLNEAANITQLRDLETYLDSLGMTSKEECMLFVESQGKRAKECNVN